MVPASVDEKVYSGVVSLVGVVTAVTSAIVGDVVSVVVVEEKSLSEPPPSLPPKPIIRINDSNRIENEKKNEKLTFSTLLEIKINLPIFSSFSKEI